MTASVLGAAAQHGPGPLLAFFAVLGLVLIFSAWLDSLARDSGRREAEARRDAAAREAEALEARQERDEAQNEAIRLGEALASARNEAGGLRAALARERELSAGRLHQSACGQAVANAAMSRAGRLAEAVRQARAALEEVSALAAPEEQQ